MTDDRTNWARAIEMPIAIADLVRIGIVLGPALAERVYYSLREEPRTLGGIRVDWLTIDAEIRRQAPRDRYGSGEVQ